MKFKKSTYEKKLMTIHQKLLLDQSMIDAIFWKLKKMSYLIQFQGLILPIKIIEIF